MVNEAVESRLSNLVPKEPTAPPPTDTRVEQLERQLAEFNQREEARQQEAMLARERAEVLSRIQSAEDFPGVNKIGEKAGDTVWQLMQQEYQQTGAWPSESEVAKRVEEDLRTLYQSLKDVYDDGLSAPVPSYEPPTLSSDQGGAVSAPRTAEPRVTDPRDLQSPAYMQALWRQVRNKR